MELKFIEIYKYFTANEYIPYVSGLYFIIFKLFSNPKSDKQITLDDVTNKAYQ